MAANDFIYSQIPIAGADIACKNTHATVAIAVGNCVTLDPANPSTAAQPWDGIVQSAANDLIFGIAIEAIAVGATGRVRTFGITYAAASGAITAGAAVQADAVGQIKTLAGSQPSVGQALTAAAGVNDLVRVLMRVSPIT